MRGRGTLAALLAAGSLLSEVYAAPALPVSIIVAAPRPALPRGFRRPRFSLRRFHGRPRVGPFRPPPLLLSPAPPDENLPPPPLGPSPLIEGEPDFGPPLPHGFEITVATGAGQIHPVPATLGRFIEVGQALAGCFAPPTDLAWNAITLRVSFKRDGSVFGLPRLPYIDAPSAEQKADLARSLLAALKACTPLRFSSALGAAIAGEIFAIRFIHQDKR